MGMPAIYADTRKLSGIGYMRMLRKVEINKISTGVAKSRISRLPGMD